MPVAQQTLAHRHCSLAGEHRLHVDRLQVEEVYSVESITDPSSKIFDFSTYVSTSTYVQHVDHLLEL